MNLSNYLHGNHGMEDETSFNQINHDHEGFGKNFGPLPTFNHIPDHLCQPSQRRNHLNSNQDFKASSSANPKL